MLIADSGSTKTDWFFVGDEGFHTHKQTPGINPFYQDSKTIFESISQLPERVESPKEIYFYGAGCATFEKNKVVEDAIRQLYPDANIEINSDLLAAARALCGKEKGIACILGTGSNSCSYDGEEIIKNVSPLGYILGDEGSGAVMGRKLISDILKNQLPDNIIKAFFNSYDLTPHDILDRVYKQSFPNRYLAQFTHFIAAHLHEESIKEILLSNFKEFFKRNVAQYAQHKVLPIHFVGSIAFHFKQELIEVSDKLGYNLGKIEKSPVNGLIQYHIGK